MKASAKPIMEPTVSRVLPVQIITMLISVSAMFVDSIIIGMFLKDDALAAYGLTTPITLFITAFGGMIGNGVQVLASESAGAGDKKRLNKVFSTSLIAGATGALAICLGTIIFSEPLAKLLGAKSEPVISLTAEYLRGIALCFPLIVCVLIIPSFLQMANGRQHMVNGTLILIVLDIGFDLLNVYAFKGGMFGMALASTLSYVIGFTYIILAYFKSSPYKLLFKDFSFKILRSVMYFGLLYLTYKMCTVLMSLSLNRILSEKGGVVLVAANSIISSVNLCLGSFPSGIGSTTTMMCSYYIGKNDEQSRSCFIKKILVIGIIIEILLAVLIISIAPFLVDLFNPDSNEIRISTESGLRLFSLSIVFNVVNYIIKNASQSMKDMKLAYLICILNDLTLPFIASMVLSYTIDLRYIWLCYCIGQATTMLAVMILLLLRKRKMTKAMKSITRTIL